MNRDILKQFRVLQKQMWKGFLPAEMCRTNIIARQLPLQVPGVWLHWMLKGILLQSKFTDISNGFTSLRERKIISFIPIIFTNKICIFIFHGKKIFSIFFFIFHFSPDSYRDVIYYLFSPGQAWR